MPRSRQCSPTCEPLTPMQLDARRLGMRASIMSVRICRRYGAAALYGLTPSCEREVVAQLVELRRAAGEYAKRDGASRSRRSLLRRAERARRTQRRGLLPRGGRGRCGVVELARSSHGETLALLSEYLGRGGEDVKIVVWAHNSHLGDATWTELGARDELNVGQLVREQHPHDSVLVGFTTYTRDSHGGERLGRTCRAETCPARARRQLRASLSRGGTRQQPARCSITGTSSRG